VSGWSIEPHEEVTDWLIDLDDKEWLVAQGHLDLLGEYGNRMRMPHSCPLGDGLFELRFTMGRRAWRITYWFAPGGVIVLLTVFRKQRQSEAQELARARAAMKECGQHHRVERRTSQ
jgi:phage-related protein